jgi:hypothetical protein
MKNRLKINCCLIALVMTVLHLSCYREDSYNTVVSTDMTKPGPVTGVQVSNFNGGAYLTYTLPNSSNILYVQADYMINSKTSRQTKSSYYSDSITVSGFAQSQDYQVTLTVVSRAEVKSDPVTVTVHPGTPPYLLALPTVTLVPDFGGVNITCKNPSLANIGIITITPDSTNKLQITNQDYTNADSTNFSLRGYDTLPRVFGVYITDQFGNVSDTVYATIKPIYEALMTKSLFNAYVLPSDVLPYSSGFGLQNLWDGNTGEPTYNTQEPILPLVWPAWMTFDMGETAKLSRYVMWDRGIDGSNNFMWGFGAPGNWVIWARADQPVDEVMPDSTNFPALGQMTPGGWIFMGEFYIPGQPSGLTNPNYTSADLATWTAGFNFNFALSLPKVRYIRFECLNILGGTNNFFDINEMSFYGDNR